VILSDVAVKRPVLAAVISLLLIHFSVKKKLVEED